jgi:ankyrin repeat protein
MCPDCATLQDDQGRTFLHVAAGRANKLSSRHAVAHYACRQGKLSSVLNARDNNGDTALHLAIRVGNLEVFNYLVRNAQVDLYIPNKDGLTPLDLSWSMIPRSLYYQSVSLFLMLVLFQAATTLEHAHQSSHIYHLQF